MAFCKVSTLTHFILIMEGLVSQLLSLCFIMVPEMGIAFKKNTRVFLSLKDHFLNRWRLCQYSFKIR